MERNSTLEERVSVLEKLTCIMAVKMMEKFGTSEMIDGLYDKVMELKKDDTSK